VEGVHVDCIPHPLDSSPPGGDDQARQAVDRSSGRMISRQPFRIQQCQRALLHRNALVHGKQAAVEIRQVYIEAQITGIGHILGCGYMRPGDVARTCIRYSAEAGLGRAAGGTVSAGAGNTFALRP
jgi:hypothetical protein